VSPDAARREGSRSAIDERRDPVRMDDRLEQDCHRQHPVRLLDRDLGPLILERNARPGLAIQTANRQGLLRRLGICEERADFSASPLERVAFAKREFRHPVGESLAPEELAGVAASG